MTPISGERRGSEDELDQLLAKEEQLQALLARFVTLSIFFYVLQHFQSSFFMFTTLSKLAFYDQLRGPITLREALLKSCLTNYHCKIIMTPIIILREALPKHYQYEQL